MSAVKTWADYAIDIPAGAQGEVDRNRDERGRFSPSSRAKAKDDGLKYYSSNKPCPNGHVGLRFVSNFGCVECLRKHCGTYHKKNRDSRLAYMSAYAKKEASANRERSMKWYEANKEKVRLYYERNPHVRRINENRRRSRKALNGGDLTFDEWVRIKDQYKSKCLCCGLGEPEIELTIDHVIPISKGGINSENNIQPLCRSCNASKGNKIADYRGQR